MGYNEEVNELLDLYHNKIETDVMPQLQEEFTKFYMGVTELTGKLKAKGVYKEDPYFKDSEIIEFVLPDDNPIKESDATWKVSERITHFESILSFVTHNYNYSLNTFNFDELEKMKKFLDYYDWKSILNPSSTDVNTRTFGKLCIDYRNSLKDSLVLSTYDKCFESITESVDSILHKLKFILIYLKERYKQFIRMDILPIVKSKNNSVGESKLPALIGKEIKDNYSYLKLYKKYIEEVVKEEFTDSGAALKEDVIKRLTIIKKQEIKETKKEYNPNEDLVPLLMEIGKVRNQFAVSIEKIYQNHLNLQSHEGNFITKILKGISKALFNIKPKTMYDLQIKSKSGGSKKMVLHFEKFYDDIKKIEYELLHFAEEDKTIIFINKNRANLNKIIDKYLMTIKKQVSIFKALDDKLKVDLKYKNIKAKGIKPELTVIKTLVNSATGRYRDYLDKTDKK